MTDSDSTACQLLATFVDIVLSYHDGMSHVEIATLTKMPLGTVKSHIRRGAQQLQLLLSDYSEQAVVEES